MTDLVTDVAVHVAFAALVAFVSLYHFRSRWYRSALGRWTMIKHCAWLAVMGLAEIGVWAPGWVARPWIRAVVWPLVAGVFVGQVVMLLAEQRLARRRARG